MRERERERERMCCFLDNIFDNFSYQGWEEQVDASVTHLLRTTLAKSSKDQAVPPNSSLEMPAECQKLKKHIALLCDRILKGWMPSGQRIEV